MSNNPTFPRIIEKHHLRASALVIFPSQACLWSSYIQERDLFDGVLWKTTVILLPGVGNHGSILLGFTSIPLLPVDRSESAGEFPEGTDDYENTIHRAIFPGK